ncbi:unnamed protein product [Peniophora sp. CBMAI 1063]|nr:unnamed protein product [Peniophora sp. CBMAI 1063]
MSDSITVTPESLDGLRINAFLVLLLAALYCFLLSAAFIAIYSLLKDGIRSLQSKVNLAAVTVMTTLTTVYTIVTILQLWGNFDRLGVKDQSLSSFDTDVTVVGGRLEFAVFAINVILGDVIILWRANVIWSWRRRIVYPSIVLLCITTVLWILAGIWGSSAIAIPASLATSLWATIVVSVKAWQRRSMLRKKVAIMSRHNALENVFNILTESGIVFTLLWVICLIASEAVYNVVFAEVMTIIMIVAAPLYPTMVVILVAQNKTPISNQLTTIEPITILDPEVGDLLDQGSNISKDNMTLDDLRR